MTIKTLGISAAVILITACSNAAPDVVIEEVAVADLPQNVLALVTAARDGFEPEEVLKKTRDGRVYYDIEGALSDGSDLEFDVLMTADGPEIVEIQRDLAFDTIPDSIQALALEASNDMVPVRVIESLQPNGAIIYEFFAEGKPKDPAYEVKLEDGEATILSERWIH